MISVCYAQDETWAYYYQRNIKIFCALWKDNIHFKDMLTSRCLRLHGSRSIKVRRVRLYYIFDCWFFSSSSLTSFVIPIYVDVTPPIYRDVWVYETRIYIARYCITLDLPAPTLHLYDFREKNVEPEQAPKGGCSFFTIFIAFLHLFPYFSSRYFPTLQMRVHM